MTIGRIPSVEGGIQPTIVDAKGDLIAATAADTVNRLAVGSNDQVLVADSSASTGLAWKSYGAQFVAGKNKIINGDFGVWQRGTSFSNPNGVYAADRFLVNASTAVPTWTVSQQTFTAGTAPVTGYEGTFFLRAAVTSQGSSTGQLIQQRVEDVRTFANQTVTFSFWAKAASTISISAVKFGQNFGSGGSGATETSFTMNSSSVGTSWARYTGTITVPSVSGKTIGTSSYAYLFVEIASSQGNYTFDTWGWQLEAGSVATPFTTATGTIQGELAACQRYYWRSVGDSVYQPYGSGYSASSTRAMISVQNPVQMRVGPTSVDFATLGVYESDAITAATNVTIARTGRYCSLLEVTTAGSLNTNRPSILVNNNSTAGYLGFSAEL